MRRKKTKEQKEEPKKLEKKNEEPKAKAEPEQEKEKKGLSVGSVNDHVETAKKGIQDFKIWGSLTTAVIAMAYPNEGHRIDLRDKEVLQKVEEKYGAKIDYHRVEQAISEKPWLVSESADYVDPKFITPPAKITKKQEKINRKKDKIRKKADLIQAKLDKMKNKKCPRALKLEEKIKELEITIDRLDFK